MLGLSLFILFWIVFGALYYTRDKSLDAEKEQAHH